ncbi:hypothetical protein D6825_00370 [Candidatus Woesearchaeota archaeon]|nr:MAG: hypothetical protein D6825_00370 [Candidatus Woesearchaeota archaeon]
MQRERSNLLLRLGIILALTSMLVLILALSASAQVCTDTDGGGAKSKDKSALETLGRVKYGLTEKTDSCVISARSEVRTNSSKYLLEYYCGDGLRESEIYDCTREGYTGCQDGKCVGASSGSSSSGSEQYTPQAVEHCGNKIVEKDKGEQCDPPGSICFGKTTAQYGSCQADCSCKIAKAALENAPKVCGDDYLDEGEECEKDSDCPNSYVCSSCSCVKQLTPEEIEELKAKAKSSRESPKEQESKSEDIASEIEEKYKTEPIPEEDLQAKNFTELASIKVTSKITKFFTGVIDWIATLFR